MTFKPTDQQKKMIEAYAAYGIPQTEMCASLGGISLMTLHKYFRTELDTGMTKANARVAESLFVQAVGAPAVYDETGKVIRAEQQRVVAAAIFWAKARMGWSEKTVCEVTGANGGPLAIAGMEPGEFESIARRLSATEI